MIKNHPSFVSDSNPISTLTHALLIWTISGKPAFASLNPVKDGEVQHQEKSLTSKQLLQLTQEVIAPLGKASITDRQIDITPERVLLSDPVNDLIVWWRPGRPTPQFFDCDELGVIQGVCHMPSLVFVQKGRSLSVCAVAGTQRPSNETPVFHAPMFNTYAGGSVCLGGIHLDSIQKWTDMDSNEDKFLRGINTHPNDNHVKTRYLTGIFALWRDLINDPELKWEDCWLNPMNCSLQEWIKGRL